MRSPKKSSSTAAAAGPRAKRASETLIAYTSLVLAGVMWVYSFLNYHHTNPITTFYQEWGTAVLGLAAMILLLGKGYWQQAEIPRIVLLPIGIMLLVVLQFLLGKVVYFGQMLLYTLYLMWAALLILLGARLREVLGLPLVATVLAAFLLVGAELNAFAGLHQHYHWHTFLEPFITVKVSAAVFGNVAQPNHYADYLVLGLASLGLLYARGALRAWQAAPLALPILYVLPLTGSRGTWFFLAWLVVSAFVWQWRDRAKRPLLYYALFVFIGFGLMHSVIQLSWLGTDTGAVDTVQRMFAENVQSGGIRLHLMHEAWVIFTQYPLLGAGFGQYGWQHYVLAPQMNNGLLGLYNNAHNLVMDLAAEGGLAALLVLAGTSLLWLRQALRAERTIYHWWGYALLAVLAMHSMLEYPLWYTYFMGIAALTLGLLDNSRYRLEFGVVGRMLVLFTLVLGAMSLQQLYTGYHAYVRLMSLRPDPQDTAAYYASMNRGIAEMQKNALLKPYADMTVSSMIEVSPERLDDKLKLNSDVVRFVPFGAVVYRQSMLLAQNGDLPEAKAEMERSIWSYPGDFPWAQEMLGNLASRDPDRFRALLEFAIQKHEEYLGAVHTK
ncbi:MAG TPA: Wzy polymerase domain-containing protein [Gallionellaceae bacterium]